MFIDTNAYSAIGRNDLQVMAALDQADSLFVSVIVLGELRAGFEHGNRKEDNERRLAQFLAKPSVSIALLHDSTTQIYAKLYAHHRKLGKPIPSNDLWISAQAIELDTPLLTLDAHFKGIKGLKLALQ